MIVILVTLRVNLLIIVILVIFISLWMPYLRTLWEFNSFKHVGYLGLHFSSNGLKSITMDRVHDKCELKLGHYMIMIQMHATLI